MKAIKNEHEISPSRMAVRNDSEFMFLYMGLAAAQPPPTPFLT